MSALLSLGSVVFVMPKHCKVAYDRLWPMVSPWATYLLTIPARLHGDLGTSGVPLSMNLLSGPLQIVVDEEQIRVSAFVLVTVLNSDNTLLMPLWQQNLGRLIDLLMVPPVVRRIMFAMLKLCNVVLIATWLLIPVSNNGILLGIPVVILADRLLSIIILWLSVRSVCSMRVLTQLVFLASTYAATVVFF